MLRIVQLIDSIEFGGAERLIIHLANYLSKGNEVYLVTLKDHSANMIPLSELSGNVKFISLGKKQRRESGLYLKLYKVLRNIKPDIIHTHLSGLAYAFPYAILKRCPVVHTVHSLASKDGGKVKLRLYKYLFKYFNIIPVAITSQVKDSILELYQIRKHIPMILNGVPRPEITGMKDEVKEQINALKLSEKDRVLINVASVKPVKNQAFLIKAVNELRIEGENLILLILGDTEAKKSGLYNELLTISDTGVFFLGVKNNIGDYLCNSDIFCLTSRYEGAPLSLIEAMALGVVPVVAHVGGIPDVVGQPTKCGFLYESDNIDDFKAVLVKILRMDKEAIRQEQQRCVTRYECALTLKNCTVDYMNLYMNIIH